MIKQYNPGQLIPFLYEHLTYEEALARVSGHSVYYEIEAAKGGALPLSFTGSAMGDIIFINGKARVKTLYEKRLLLMRGCRDVTPEYMVDLLKKRHLKKILVIRNAAFGDLQMATRAFQLLREKYPEAQIHFYGREDSRDVAMYSQYCDGIIDIRTTEIGQIAKYYDEVFDLVHTIECNATADYKDALDVLEDFLFVDTSNPPSNIYHVTNTEYEKAHSYIRKLGFTSTKNIVVFQYEGTAIARSLSPVTTFLIAKELAEQGNQVLLWSHKDDLVRNYRLVRCLSTGKYAAFTKESLVLDEKGKLLLPNKFGVKSEHEVVNLHPNIRHDLICPDGSPMKYDDRRSKFALLGFAKHIIAVDSFIGHIADAMKKSCTMIFTNYHPHTRVKYYEKTDVVSVDFEKDLACGPCNGLLNECPLYQGTIPACSQLISVKEVVSAVNKRLRGEIPLHQKNSQCAIPEDYEKHEHCCKVCGSKDTRLLTVKGKIPYLRCESCSSIFADSPPQTKEIRFLKNPHYCKERNISNLEEFTKTLLGKLNIISPYSKIGDLIRLSDEDRIKKGCESISNHVQFESVNIEDSVDSIKEKGFHSYLMIDLYSEFETKELGLNYLDNLLESGQKMVLVMPVAEHWNFTNTWQPILQPIAGINQIIYSTEGLQDVFDEDKRFSVGVKTEIAKGIYLWIVEKK